MNIFCVAYKWMIILEMHVVNLRYVCVHPQVKTHDFSESLW